MVFILGVNLPDKKIARIALTAFYGIGHKTAERICARMNIHERARVGELTQHQVTGLAAFLSSPSTAPTIPHYTLLSPTVTSPHPPTLTAHLTSPAPQGSTSHIHVLSQDEAKKSVDRDPLRKLRIEQDLRREMRENIAHQRMIGSYVGRRHAMHLPVRGQNTQTNAKTARRLNRVDRHN